VGVGKLCGLFGMTRQAWYKSRKEKERREMEPMAVIWKIKEIRKELPRCGGKKLYFLIKDFLGSHGIQLGRDRFFDLLREHNLLIKRKKGRKTTFSFHRFRKYPNTAKDIEVVRPDQLWVSDITYIMMGANVCYLSLVTDAFSRKIIGWSLRPDLTAKGPLEALGMAVGQRSGGNHSDRGIQYCCHEYTRFLKKNRINISMTQNGDPGENAMAERINGTLKGEFLHYWFHGNHDAAVATVTRAIRNYNEIRPHESLGYRTPSEVHISSTFTNQV